jgi:hypothetical protein
MTAVAGRSNEVINLDMQGLSLYISLAFRPFPNASLQYRYGEEASSIVKVSANPVECFVK